MSFVLKVPANFASLHVEDEDYFPDKNGFIKVEQAHHVNALVELGATYGNEIVQAPAASEDTSEEAKQVIVNQTPSDTSDGSLEVKNYPNDNWKKAEILQWLSENEIAVNPDITKAAALTIVAGIKAEG